MTSPRHQGADLTCATKQDSATEEKDADSNKVSSVNMSDNAIQTQETTVFKVNDESQLEGYIVHVDNGEDANQNEKCKEETMEVKFTRLPSQTSTDQLQGLLPNSEVGYGSFATPLDEQLGTKENVQFNLERIHETSHKECNDVSGTEEVTKEAEVLLPDRKKRRMGMCGLMLKELSHFLHVQKFENGQNRMEEPERLLHKKIVSSPPSLFSLSFPAGSVKELNTAEVQVQSRLSGGDDRSEKFSKECRVDVKF